MLCNTKFSSCSIASIPTCPAFDTRDFWKESLREIAQLENGPGKRKGLKTVSESRGVLAAVAMDQRGSLKSAIAKDKGVDSEDWVKAASRWFAFYGAVSASALL